MPPKFADAPKLQRPANDHTLHASAYESVTAQLNVPQMNRVRILPTQFPFVCRDPPEMQRQGCVERPSGFLADAEHDDKAERPLLRELSPTRSRSILRTAEWALTTMIRTFALVPELISLTMVTYNGHVLVPRGFTSSPYVPSHLEDQTLVTGNAHNFRHNAASHLSLVLPQRSKHPRLPHLSNAQRARRDTQRANSAAQDVSLAFTNYPRIPGSLFVMAYPPPPGLKTSQPSSSSSTPHPSLPARPPPSAHPAPSFKPAFTPPSVARGAPGYGNNDGKGTGTGTGTATYGGFTGFKPRTVAASTPTWQAQPSISAQPTPPSVYAQPQTSYNGGGYQVNPYQQQAYYPQASDPYEPTPPQIRNPFPLPGQEQNAGAARTAGAGRGRFGDSTFDPEYEAQIAQWQSAYAGKDDGAPAKGAGRGKAEGAASAGGANAIPLGGRAAVPTPISNTDMNAAVHADTGVAAVVAGPDGKQMTVVRSGGGQTWQDPSLLDWDPAHFRLFVGNLAGEVTDESLLKAFSRYSSVQKARVVRDKRTTKSRGFGFVSFSSGDDYFNAAKEMQGKYIGSHPVLIKRSTTEIKATVPQDRRNNKKGGKGGKGGSSAVGGASTGAGVHKKQSKTKGGLKVLG